MAEYIKIEDIPFKDLATGHGAANRLLVAFASDIASLPIVEIVRCKDCLHWNSETKGCKRNPSVEAWHETDFCNYGERSD